MSESIGRFLKIIKTLPPPTLGQKSFRQTAMTAKSGLRALAHVFGQTTIPDGIGSYLIINASSQV
jgi:hypothetical protein